jgi:integrase
MSKTATGRQAPSEKIGNLVSIYQRGSRWHATFQFDGRQHRQSLKTTNKKEARLRAVRLEARLLDGEFPGTRRAATLAAAVEAYERYLKNEHRAKKTLEKYIAIFTRLTKLCAARGVVKLAGVNLELLDAYKNQRLAEGVGEKTIHTELVVLRQLVNFSWTRKMLASDPLAGLKLKRPKLRTQPCWSKPQVEQIITTSREPQKSMLTALADTGMRIGELKHLTWADVDFEHGQILIREKPGWKPKTGDHRAVPMTPRLRQLLGRLDQSTPWVFTLPRSADGQSARRQVCERRLLEYLKRRLKKLKLPGHLHTFRHSFISHALCSGIPEAIVRSWVGHVDSEIIRHYTHVLDETSRAAMERLVRAPSSSHRPTGQEV